MSLSSEYCVTAELFVIPEDDQYILYAPLKGVVARTSGSAAALLRDIKRGDIFELNRDEVDFLESLVKVDILNGTPDMKLTVHNEGDFTPTHVTLFLTDACNLRCIYCYAKGGDSLKPTTIPIAAAKAGIDYVAKNARKLGMDTFSIGFHGAGEPTVAWNKYVELVNYAHDTADSMNMTASITTCTNGILSSERAEWLANNTSAATVSSDGLAEFQNLQRPKANGSGSFDDLMHTLKIFDENDFFYAIRATITEQSVNFMAEMVEFYDDNCNAGDLQFDPLIFTGRCIDTGCQGPLDDVYIEEYIRAYETARKRSRMIGFSCLSFTSLKSFYCCAVADGFTVTHDGYVTSCFEACAPDRPFGNVFIYGKYNEATGSFDLDLDKLRKLQTRNIYNLPYCKDCFCKYMCAGDCPIHSLKAGYGLERGTRCELTQAIARYRLGAVVNDSEPIVHIPINKEEIHV
jgi:uncharacterized protein